MRTTGELAKKLRSRKREKLAVINPVAPAAPIGLLGQLGASETRFEELCKGRLAWARREDNPRARVLLAVRVSGRGPIPGTAAARPAEPEGIRPLVSIDGRPPLKQKSEARSRRRSD